MRVSICSPVHNEQDNIEALVDEIRQVADPAFGRDWEQVLVDDGSSDESARLIQQAAHNHHALRLVSHPRNRGERAAWATAFAHAGGEVVVMLAADLQNDPADIPKLVDVVERGEADCATGARTDRKDGLFYWVATRVLNGTMNRLFDLNVRDVSSSFFAVRRRFVRDLPLWENDHRYILALFRRRGATIRELPTAHRPRTAGASHYARSKVVGAVPEFVRFYRRQRRGDYTNKPVSPATRKP